MRKVSPGESHLGEPFFIAQYPISPLEDEAGGLIIWRRLELSGIPLVEGIDGEFEAG